MVNFCLKSRGVFVYMCAYVCVPVNVCMFVYMLLLARTYIRIFAYIVACIFTYVYSYFRSLLFVRSETKEEAVRKEQWVKRGCGMDGDIYLCPHTRLDLTPVQ